MSPNGSIHPVRDPPPLPSETTALEVPVGKDWPALAPPDPIG